MKNLLWIALLLTACGEPAEQPTVQSAVPGAPASLAAQTAPAPVPVLPPPPVLPAAAEPAPVLARTEPPVPSAPPPSATGSWVVTNWGRGRQAAESHPTGSTRSASARRTASRRRRQARHAPHSAPSVGS